MQDDDIPRNREQVEQWCAQHDIMLSVRGGPFGIIHVHADIMAPKSIFRAHALHNLGLWDEPRRPDWKAIGRELIEADFGPCEDPDCEYCEGDE